MRRIRKQISQSASRIRRRVKIKRQTYADLRYLVSLELLAKKLKLPFIQRADKNTPRPTDSASALEETGTESIVHNGEMASPESRPGSRHTLLVIDQRLSMYYGSRQKMKSVVAAEAAALIAWHAFAQKDRVGGIAFNDREVMVLSPHYGRVQIMLILHDLLNLNHRLSSNAERKSNPGMLNQALRRVAATTDARSQIVLITDSSGQDQVTGQILQSISAHNDLVVILVYDPRQVDCSDGDRSNSTKAMSFRPNLDRSCLFADGTLTIPLNNQVDTIDQFRRGFRKLLRLRRYQSKQQVQPSQHGGDPADQTGSILETPNGGNETAVSRIPTTLATPQPLCAQLNSR